MVTIGEIRHHIKYIKAVAHDDEQAHLSEDALWKLVLEDIASGGTYAANKAQLVLTTMEIKFERSCS